MSEADLRDQTLPWSIHHPLSEAMQSKSTTPPKRSMIARRRWSVTEDPQILLGRFLIARHVGPSLPNVCLNAHFSPLTRTFFRIANGSKRTSLPTLGT